MALLHGRLPRKLTVSTTIATTLATAYLTAAQFYGSLQHLYGVLPAIGVVGAVAIGGGVRSAFSSTVEAKMQRQFETIDELLEGLLLTAADLTGCSIRDVSATYLSVHGKKGTERLRVAHWTGFGGHAPSNVELVRRKGVAGECWDDQQPRFRDLRHLNATMDGCDQATWEAVTNPDKQGFTFEEWRRLQNKHQTLVVACTHEMDDAGVEQAVSGVVSLSFSSSGNYEPWSSQLVQAVVGAAHAIAIALK